MCNFDKNLIQFLPQCECWTEFRVPESSVKPIPTLSTPHHHPELRDHMTTDHTLARAVNVGWQAKEGRQVPLRERGNQGCVILRSERIV